MAPASEVALRTLRTSITKTLAYTTKQRSSDLTFATASHGPDLDPETHIFSRRAVAFRRYVTRSPNNKAKMKEIFEAYRKAGEPGVHKDDEQLKKKRLGGDPATAERAAVRNEGSPRGPCGYLLESIQLQSATLDEEYNIK